MKRRSFFAGLAALFAPIPALPATAAGDAHMALMKSTVKHFPAMKFYPQQLGSTVTVTIASGGGTWTKPRGKPRMVMIEVIGAGGSGGSFA